MSDEDEDRPEPLKRTIAITLALLVVLGGVIAIQENTASVNESNSARETTRVAVRAMRAHVARDAVAGAEAGRRGERAFLAFRRPLTPASPTELRAARRALPAGRTPAELDQLRFAAEHETLRQHTLATTRITWNDVATRYTTVIAVLAAALFFVGFALTVEGPPRRVSYALGVGVALFAAGWTVYIHEIPIPGTPERALAAASTGAVLTGHRDYAGAVAAYDRALRADPDFAAAYTGRAEAKLLGANPDLELTNAFTDVGGRASEAATGDAQRALDLGERRDLPGFGLVALAGIYRGRDDQTLHATGDALRINARVPDFWLMRSAAQLAMGDTGAADASLLRALGLIGGAEPSERVRQLAAGYLSFLAAVEQRVPARAPVARRLATRFVAYETAFTLGRSLTGSLPATGGASVDRLRYAAGHLTMRVRWHDLPAGTALTAIGYERPLPGGAWTQPPKLALFVDVAGSGQRDIDVALDPVCKPTAVRADLFLNGIAAGTRTGPGVAATCRR